MKKVLVTGGTGFIGSWVVKMLLEKGVNVNLTVRKKSNKINYDFLEDYSAESLGSLSIWEADLLKEGSYDEAMAECDVVFHIASPFVINVKNPQEQLIDPALKGTKNVLNSANKCASVKKVILTSSIAAIYGDNADMKEKGITTYNESHFNSSSSIDHQPYPYSKVLAEKAAWEIANSQDNWNMVVINPGFVMGPVLSKRSNSESIVFMKDMLKGKFSFGVPNLKIAYVDVRDVANAHILAAEIESVEGRHILVNRVYSMLNIGKTIGNLFCLLFDEITPSGLFSIRRMISLSS